MYVCEITKRRYRGRPEKEIRGPDDAFQVLKKRFKHGEARELFLAVLLSARNTVIGVEIVSVGSLTSSLAHPREVFRPAIQQAAASLIVAHNHPSGNPEPSEDDIALTRRLREAGELVGIAVLDHLIVAGGRFTSLKEDGHMP